MNKIIYDDSKIEFTKGNIPIYEGLLNRYSNVKEIFYNESKNFDCKIKVKEKIPELNGVNINFLSIAEIKKLARKIFYNYSNQNEFINNENKILVTNSGLDESITKIISVSEQKKLLLEHIRIFSELGNIIENSKLVNQVSEIKGRKKYNFWNYYFNKLIIDGNNYILEFEVVSMDNGENHYRVQRLKKLMLRTETLTNRLESCRLMKHQFLIII